MTGYMMPDRDRVARAHTPSLRPLLLLALLSAACSGTAPSEESPRPTEVVPNAGYSTAPTAVEIHGSRFLAQATLPSGGGSPTLDTRHRAWLDDAELQEVTWVSTTTMTATVPSGLSPGPHGLTVQNALGERGTLDAAFTVLSAPSFSATIAADRTTASVGQTFKLTLTVANNGSSDVTSLALGTPALTWTDGGAATPSGAAPSPPATLAVGGRQSFTWTYQATSAGHLSATVSATGRDARSGAALTATPPSPAQVAIQKVPDIRAALSIPPSVAAGKDFTVTMTVTNLGGADALAVTPATPSVVAGSAGTASLKTGTGATPASAGVPAGQAATFTWTYTAGATTGSLQLSGGATGKDANSGAVVTAPTATSNSTWVGKGAIAVKITSSPAHAAVGQVFAVEVTFSNPGTANVTGFSAAAPSPDPTKVTVTGPTPAALATLTTTQPQKLSWNVSTSVAGRLAITFLATGLDSGTSHQINVSATATIDVP